MQNFYHARYEELIYSSANYKTMEPMGLNSSNSAEQTLICRPYEARQEELVRAINSQIRDPNSSIPRDLLIRLRMLLLDEQSRLSGPTLAFINGCRLVSRLDLA